MADRLETTNVERFAVGRVAGARTQERIHRVVDVDEVTKLRAVAEDLDFLVLEHEADEPGNETLAAVFQQLPRTVDVGQAQRGGAHAEHVVVDQMVVLARRLVDTVDVRWPHEMRLGDRQTVRTAVDLPRAGEHHFHGRIVDVTHLSARLKITSCPCTR